MYRVFWYLIPDNHCIKTENYILLKSFLPFSLKDNIQSIFFLVKHRLPMTKLKIVKNKKSAYFGPLISDLLKVGSKGGKKTLGLGTYMLPYFKDFTL